MAYTKEQKAAYDRLYRKKNLARIKARKKAYYARVGPQRREKEREERKKRAPQHAEYCRQPEYKVWKREYDRKRRSKKFGPFAECHELLLQLTREIHRQMPDRFERYAQAQRHQWNPINQQRRKHGNRNEPLDSL